MTSPSIWRPTPAVVLLSIISSLLGACSGTIPPPAPEPPDAQQAWKEDPLRLPAFPQNADLLPMAVSRAVPEKILIDSKSISVGNDEVVRYTVVVESSSGVRNVFYEGIRCDTREYKRYAYGTTEKTFAPMANSSWQKIYVSGLSAFRYEAYNRYFCYIVGRTAGNPIPKPAEIIEAIRHPQTDHD